MQVIHTVKCTDEEVETLFEIAKKAGGFEESTAYDASEKLQLLTTASKNFDKLLAKYADEAFKYGYNEGLNNANVKDTAMYKPMTYAEE